MKGLIKEFKFIKALTAISLALSFFSCATYNQRIRNYYTSLREEEYEIANKRLEKIPLLKKGRNELLYLLEKGKTLHLLQQYDSSNRVFNKADYLMENAQNTIKDAALTYLVNQMVTTYRGEDFERFMVHYYKALNYLYLGKTEDALVEARRITLANYSQQEKFTNNNKYTQDAFSLMLQGIIFEKGKDINNAFIAYRNAIEIFAKNNNEYYGVQIPGQLKKDVVRTANALGFYDEQNRLEQELGIKFIKENKAPGGELIVFWENGLAPVKQQKNISFTLIKNDAGLFSFRDSYNELNIPFDYDTPGYNSSVELSDIKIFSIALPQYIQQRPYYMKGNLIADSINYTLEKAQDIGVIAQQSLKQRFIKELGKALSRMALKKLAEAIAEKKENKSDLESVLTDALSLYNLLSEKADTRNWQSLPNRIYYSRIPLKAGENNILLQMYTRHKQVETKNFYVNGNGGLQFLNIVNLQ